MPEKLAPFEKGVTFEWTCPHGVQSRICLWWVDEMRPNERQDYIATCSAACQSCPLKEKGGCGGIDHNGVARADGVNRKAQDLLKELHTPCVKGKL